MPGWHEATLERQQRGDFQMLGIIQEQHPDRTALFMQWKGMEWPILVDSLNLLGTQVVPQTLLIDEHGIIRSTRARPEHLDGFLSSEFEAPSGGGAPPVSADADRRLAAADALFLGGDQSRLDEVVATYRELAARRPGDAPLQFRLGVALRARYDSPRRQPADFADAVASWKRALDLNPNQYIWRRRIQQYGPRLDKPYSFYDWVTQARQEISARGEQPRALRIEPRGAEFARPAKEFAAARAEAEPDAGGRIHRDDGLIRMQALLVPDTSEPPRAGRIHLTLTPNGERKAHWNNEVEDLLVWVEPPDGWETDQRRLSVESPPEAVSLEERHLEFEVRRTDLGAARELSGYALYYVCEDVDGTCLYRRQDFRLTLPGSEEPRKGTP